MWVPFSSSGERIPMLSAMTLDQLGAKMVTINAASARSDTILQIKATRPGSFEAFRWHGPVPSRIRFSPRRQDMRTLRDAASYIMALPGKTRQSDEWQAAIEALLMAAEDRGPLMHARIGIMRALNRGYFREFNPSRKDTHWGRRKLKRDE
jgi:hypothetical protein